MRATWWLTVALGLSPDYPSCYSPFSSRSEDNTDYEDQPMDEDSSTTNEEVDVYEEVGACRGMKWVLTTHKLHLLRIYHLFLE